MNGMIKVTDFGLTEYMRSSNYFRKGQTDSGVDEKMPIRWMAPESIDGDLYTEKTDVVSFLLAIHVYTVWKYTWRVTVQITL